MFDLIPDHAGLTYVGRLDVMTTGLLLLTTDGEAVHRLTHPRYHIQRKYTALVHGRSTAEITGALRENVVLDGRPVIPRDVRVRPGKDGRSIIDVTFEEGRNRLVRRWCEEMGLKVERLARLSYGPVRLGDLPPGRYRPLLPKEEDRPGTTGDSGLWREKHDRTTAIPPTRRAEPPRRGARRPRRRECATAPGTG